MSKNNDTDIRKKPILKITILILSIISLKINLKHKEIKKCFIDILLKVKEVKNVIDILISLCIM